MNFSYEALIMPIFLPSIMFTVASYFSSNVFLLSHMVFKNSSLTQV